MRPLHQTTYNLLKNVNDKPNVNISIAARQSITSYAHAADVIQLMKLKGLVTVIKEGRDNKCNITLKGKKLLHHYEQLMELIR